MKRKFVALFITLLICPSLALPQQIIEPVKAGTWYPKEKEVLSSWIDGFLQNVKFSSQPSGEVLCIIAPHAGYTCSGQIAAYSYKLVQGKDYETVIIIAPTHTIGFEGCSIYPQGGYRTPLGVTEVDSNLAAELSKASGFSFVPQAHTAQHPVETQIPFIQKVLPKAKIVSVVMGYPYNKTIRTLAKALTQVTRNKKVLIVVSTDMSHYLPQKKAQEVDSQTISLLTSFKTNELIKRVEQQENIMCGGGAVVSALLHAQERGNASVTVLKKDDSSGCDGTSEVVGYLAAAISLEKPQPSFTLSSEEKEELLKLARSAVSEIVLERKIVDYENKNAHFEIKKGAFVTLKNKGLLRGCIGIIEPLFALQETIIRAAISAACTDPRFPPISPGELHDLEVEISVLSPLKKIDDPQYVEVGKHGLVISQNGRTGLLLPQVPVENNWTRTQFLEQACLKAGLPQNAWKKGAEIYVFEAIVFH